MNKELLQKIDGFAKLVQGRINVEKRTMNGHTGYRIIVDSPTILYTFMWDCGKFMIFMRDKLSSEVIHKSQCEQYDQESIIYDFETLVEILQAYALV